jgi:hypothetical protein
LEHHALTASYMVFATIAGASGLDAFLRFLWPVAKDVGTVAPITVGGTAVAPSE